MSVSCASVAQVLFCTFRYGSRKFAIFVTYLGLSGWTLTAEEEAIAVAFRQTKIIAADFLRNLITAVPYKI
jgi:prophage maintenance system killer protein